MQDKTHKKLICLLVAAMLGFFPLVAQTLLFRDFLSVYEGSELGIGVFFSSWLLWVALGALVARKIPPMPHAELLFLLYIPAYILQHLLICNSRELAGVRAWELFPLLRMLPVSFLANAAVSFVTGLLFPLSCRWFEQQKSGMPVSRVYAAEALGSFSGGLAVTALLMAGVWPESIFLVSSLVLTTVVLLSCRRKTVLSAVAVLLVALTFSGYWNKFESRKAWERLLPIEQYRGVFTTAHARYLYGSHRDQFNVVSFEAVSETIPQREYASQLAALHLAQKPDASRILVLGTDAYALCRRLAELPSITHITWLHPDLSYTARLIEVLPPDLKTGREKIEMPAMDVRGFLQSGRAFDLVIIKQPNIATLAGNRYYTQEFFRLIQKKLAPGGVIGVRVPGGENFMGDELVRIGASVFQTLGGVFADMALKPGDETWLLASDTDNQLTQNIDQLISRFAAIDSAAALFPPSGLRSLYSADRAEFQMKAYRKIQDEKLINRDRHPQALFHTLLLAGRQGGAGEKSVQAVVTFSRHGFVLILSLFLIYGLLRAIYLERPGRNNPSIFDSGFLVASTGFVGLALNVVLMFLFQSRFGSIFLYIGLISSLFMLGLFCGALLTRRKNKLPLILPLHVLCTAAIILLPDALPMVAYFAVLFLFGLFSGVYIPATARLLPSTALRTGSAVELYDHFGGAVGGLLIGILFLPIFGITQTLFLLAVLLAINIYPVLFAPAIRKVLPAVCYTDRLRAVGYILFGVSAFFLINYHVMSSKDDANGSGYEEAAEMLKQQAAGTSIRIFDSRKQAPGIFGYGGPLWMAVAIDDENHLTDYKIYQHQETPSYLRMTEPWMKQFIGDDLSSRQLQGIDAVSGATLTCNAFKKTLITGAASFQGKQSAQPRSMPLTGYASLLIFALLCASALFLRKKAGSRERRLFLILVLLLMGVHLNMQYSTDHLLRLLALELPPLRSLVPFLLSVAVPLLVMLFGNIYCGWLCPFGALQELAGCCIRRTPDKTIWRYARFVKYILLSALVIFFGCGGGGEIYTADPLVSFFSCARSTVILCFGVATVVLSLFFGRFWCRNICPAGAFLSLLNRIRLLRRWIPDVPFARCDYGVTHRDELDCICCDRCRYQDSAQSRKCANTRVGKMKLFAHCSLREIILLISVVAVAALWLSQMRYTQEKRGILKNTSKVLPITGKVRNADMDIIRNKIRRSELSDHEALYYDKLENLQNSARKSE